MLTRLVAPRDGMRRPGRAWTRRAPPRPQLHVINSPGSEEDLRNLGLSDVMRRYYRFTDHEHGAAAPPLPPLPRSTALSAQSPDRPFAFVSVEMLHERIILQGYMHYLCSRPPPQSRFQKLHLPDPRLSSQFHRSRSRAPCRLSSTSALPLTPFEGTVFRIDHPPFPFRSTGRPIGFAVSSCGCRRASTLQRRTHQHDRSTCPPPPPFSHRLNRRRRLHHLPHPPPPRRRRHRPPALRRPRRPAPRRSPLPGARLAPRLQRPSPRPSQSFRAPRECCAQPSLRHRTLQFPEPPSLLLYSAWWPGRPARQEHPDDIATYLAGIRLALRLVAAPAFRAISDGRIRVDWDGCRRTPCGCPPGATVEDAAAASDSFWECMVRAAATTVYHPAGTARMGRPGDPATVYAGPPRALHFGATAMRSEGRGWEGMPLCIPAAYHAATVAVRRARSESPVRSRPHKRAS